jgi:hypothetical protein
MKTTASRPVAQTARYLRHVLKMKGLFWLPTLDAFRTFVVEFPSGILPGFLSIVSGQTEVRAF